MSRFSGPSSGSGTRRGRQWVAGLAVAVVVALALGGCSDAGPASPVADITLADLNLLHGAFCPQDSGRCRLAERVDLLLQLVVGRGCPDLVTLQEVWAPTLELLEPHLATTCPFPYERIVGERSSEIDDEAVLTRYPALAVEQRYLYRGFRKVLFVRIDHPSGPLDVFTTHLASGADGAERPCGSACPAECVAAGATTVRECQAVQLASFVAERRDESSSAIVTRDLNDPPGSFVYRQLAERGWIDAYLAAGNPECDPESGTGCTAGRVDQELVDLESPALGEHERIDYVFVAPPRRGASCVPRVEAGDHGDPGRGAGTRLFADVPNPFAPACGPAPLPICWPSDHVGVQLSLACD